MKPPKGPTLRVAFDPTPEEWERRSRSVVDQMFSLFLGDLEKERFPQSLIRLIQERTKSGKDKEGATFKQYAPTYPKPGRPDLSVTGKLLASLAGSKVSDGFEVRPAGSHGSVANQMLASFVSKKRPFVGFDKQDEKKIVTMMFSVFRNRTAEKIQNILSGRR